MVLFKLKAHFKKPVAIIQSYHLDQAFLLKWHHMSAQVEELESS